MILRVIITNFLFIFSFSNLYAQSFGPYTQTQHPLQSQGVIQNIPQGSYIRMTNYVNNFHKWYNEVILVNKNNQPLYSSPLKISKQYSTNEFENTLNSDQKFLDTRTGAEVNVNSGQKYMVVDTNNKGWKTYSVQFIDKDGTPINHKGKSINSAHTYKISQKYLENDQFKPAVENFKKIEEISNKNLVKVKECLVVEDTTSSKLEKTTPADIKEAKSSYAYLMSKRKELRALGKTKCKVKKKEIEKLFLESESSEYKDLKTLGQRANKIHSDAKAVLKQMKSSAGDKNKKSTSGYKSRINGHYFDPLLTPELASCIAFQETRGSLNPYAVNYTYCEPNNQRTGGMISTAHGLGQMTRTTLGNVKNFKGGNLLPLDTPTSKKYKNFSAKEIHTRMSSDPKMQLEVTLRTLNDLIKNARINKLVLRNPYKADSTNEYVKKKYKQFQTIKDDMKNLSRDQKILWWAVYHYDQDHPSNYLQNVVRKCLPCFKGGKKAAECK